MKIATSARTYLIRSLCVTALLIIGSYTLFAFRHIIEGPLITVNYPLSGIEVSAPVVEVRGSVKNASHVSLNDRKVFTDPEGNLRESILLAEGLNVIRLSAQDRFGRTTVEEFMVTLSPGASSTATHLIHPSL